MHHSNTGPHTFANDSPDAIPDATPDAIPGSTLHAISDTTPYTSANASSKPIQLLPFASRRWGRVLAYERGVL